MALDPITAALDIGGKLIDRFFPDPAQADAARLQLLQLQQSGELAQMTGQMEINKVEAANGSVFVSGWRPFLGWICGAALAYHYVARPMLVGIVGYPMPALDTGDLFGLTTNMLGLAWGRTTEKLNGVASK